MNELSLPKRVDLLQENIQIMLPFRNRASSIALNFQEVVVNHKIRSGLKTINMGNLIKIIFYYILGIKTSSHILKFIVKNILHLNLNLPQEPHLLSHPSVLHSYHIT